MKNIFNKNIVSKLILFGTLISFSPNQQLNATRKLANESYQKELKVSKQLDTIEQQLKLNKSNTDITFPNEKTIKESRLLTRLNNLKKQSQNSNINNESSDAEEIDLSLLQNITESLNNLTNNVNKPGKLSRFWNHLRNNNFYIGNPAADFENLTKKSTLKEKPLTFRKLFT